jgi:hypothetical protein
MDRNFAWNDDGPVVGYRHASGMHGGSVRSAREAQRATVVRRAIGSKAYRLGQRPYARDLFRVRQLRVPALGKRAHHSLTGR